MEYWKLAMNQPFFELFHTSEAAAMSFNVRGVLISLQAICTEAATSPETSLPRDNFLQ
jgi:hypothetical protein